MPTNIKTSNSIFERNKRNARYLINAIQRGTAHEIAHTCIVGRNGTCLTHGQLLVECEKGKNET